MLTATASSPQPTVPAIGVTWVAPNECERRGAFLGEVSRILGASRPSEPLTVRVELTREGTGRWHVVLVVRGRGNTQSERAFDAASCDAAVSAAALITAVAADGARPPLEAPPVVQAVATESPSRAAVPISVGPQLAISAGAVGEFGTLPAAAPGAEVSIGGRIGSFGGTAHLRALVTATYLSGQTDPLTGHAESADLQLDAVAGRACFSIGRAWIDVGPCVGGEFEAMSGTGVRNGANFTPQPGSVAWVALLGSMLGWLRLTAGIGLFARADAIVSLARPHLDLQTLAGRQAVVLPSQFAGGAAFGVELLFF